MAALSFDDLIPDSSGANPAASGLGAAPLSFDDLVPASSIAAQPDDSSLTDYTREGVTAFAEQGKNLFAGALKGYGAAAPAIAERSISALDNINAPLADDSPEARAAYRVRRGVQHPSDDVIAQRRAALQGRADLPIAEQPLYRAGRAVEDFGKEALGASPGWEKSWTRDIMGGLGSMTAGVGVSMIPGAGPGLAATIFLGAGMGEAVDKAIKEGATEEQARRAAELGSIAGATDMIDALLPALGSTGKALGFIRRVGTRAIYGSLAEGGQEGLQQFIQNMIAKGVYKPDHDLMEDVLRSAAIGAIVGGVTSGGFAAVQRQQPVEVAGQPIAQPEDIAPPGAVPADMVMPAAAEAPAPAAGTPAAPIESIPTGAMPAETMLPSAGQPYTAQIQAPQAPPPQDPAGRHTLQAMLDDPRTAEEMRADLARAEKAAQAAADRIGAVAPAGSQTSVTINGLTAQPAPPFGHDASRETPPQPVIREGTAAMYDPAAVAVGPEQTAQPTAAPVTPGSAIAGAAPTTEIPPPSIGDGTRTAPVDVQTSSDVAKAAAAATTNYSPKQGEANNRQLGHAKWNGLEASIEVAAGGVRRGTKKTGEPTQTTFTAPYGYWKKTVGADKMPVDAYFGPHIGDPNLPAYVLDELDSKTGKFRQIKTFAGFASPEAATQAYLGTSTKGPENIGGITAIPAAEFPAWVSDEKNTTKRLSAPPADIKVNTPKQRQGKKGPLSLIEFIAQRGGIDPRDPLIGDVRMILGTPNRYMRGYGMLIRPGGKYLDNLHEAAVEAGYLHDEARNSGGVAQSTTTDLLNLLDGELRGQKAYSDNDRDEVANRQDMKDAKAQAEQLARAQDEVRAVAKRDGYNASDEQVRRAAEASLVNDADPIDALVDILERDAIADRDDLAETVKARGEKDAATGTDAGRARPAATVQSAGPADQASDGGASARVESGQDQLGRGETRTETAEATRRPEGVRGTEAASTTEATGTAEAVAAVEPDSSGKELPKNAPTINIPRNIPEAAKAPETGPSDSGAVQVQAPVKAKGVAIPAKAEPTKAAAGDEPKLAMRRDEAPAEKQAAPGVPDYELRTPFTPAFLDHANAVQPLLRAELNRLGLHDIALKLADRINLWVQGRHSSADGVYWKRTVTLALDADHQFRTLHHEALHALRELGLFTDGGDIANPRDNEWGLLERMSKAKWREQFEIDRFYPEVSEETKNEEGIAYAYAAWADGKLKVDGRFVRLFKRIKAFLEALGNALRGNGFKTVESIFSDIKSGEVGKRFGAERAGEPMAAARKGDSDLFKTEVVQTPDGPREQGVIPGAEKISEKERLQRQANKPLKPGKAQKDVDGLPLFNDEPSPDLPMFALKREPETAQELMRVSQGFIARGQFIDRAMRVPFDYAGGLTKDGQWKPGLYLWDKHPTAMAGALIGARIGAAITNPIGAAAGHIAGKLVAGKVGAGVGETVAAFTGGLPGAAVGAVVGGAGGRLIMAKFSPAGRFAFMNPILETARSNLIDRYNLRNLPEYVTRERDRALDERAKLMQANEILKAMNHAGVGLQEARVLHAIITEGAVASADMAALAEPIQAAVDQWGQEAVAYGLVSAESFERNRGTYMHRVYLKDEAEQHGLRRMVNGIMGSRRKKIIGDQYKGRGIFNEIELPRLMRDVPDWHEGARGKPENGEKFVRLDEMATQQQLALDEKKTPEKVLRTVYLPVGRQIPDRYSAFRNQGTWEVRGSKNGKIVIWRDFTKEERTKLGEILDARYTFAKTAMLTAHDLSVGKFYKDISQNEDWTSSTPPDGRIIDAAEWQAGRRAYKPKDHDWVRVPETEIGSTGGKKRWGALAGKWVREEIWRDLNELEILSRPSTWRAIMTGWKKNKTARSPNVHMNNVVSNFTLMDLLDVRFQDLIDGIRSFAKGDRHYEEAFKHGAFGADMITQEIRDQVLKPILDEIARSNSLPAGRLGLMGQASKFTELLWSKLQKLDQKMVDLYRVEDEIFRMATYLRRIQLGDTPKQAADHAREQFIDYDIRAPGIRALRNTAVPFISYTYRAGPLVAKAVATRPWKLAKYALLGYVLNALAYAVTGGDEDKERRSLREQEQGNTWVGTERMTRMPWNSQKEGFPVFLDIRRFMPAGDIVDFNQGQTALPIVPAWLMIGGPMVLGAEFFFNKQMFTGREITNDKSDDWWDKTTKTANWAWKSWMPNAPWVPSSYSNEKIWDAAWGAREKYTDRPLSLPQALLSSVGIKIKPEDMDRNFARKGREFKKVFEALKTEERDFNLDHEAGTLSDSAFDRKTKNVDRKRQNAIEKMTETFKD